MVQILTVFLLSVHMVHASMSRPILLRWVGKKPVECRELVELFLAELRTIASDRGIELEALEDQTKGDRSVDSRNLDIKLSCPDFKPGSDKGVELAFSKRVLFLRYQKRAGGFDPLDWLLFQKAALSELPTEPDLSLPVEKLGSARDTLPSETPNTTTVTTQLEPSPLYKKWWFWGSLVATGAGVFGITQLISRGTPEKNIEIQ